jgi:hypothetical protein
MVAAARRATSHEERDHDNRDRPDKLSMLTPVTLAVATG